MDTTHFPDIEIQQGASYTSLSIRRLFAAVPVRQAGCSVINTCSGQPIDLSTIAAFDYTGSTAIMKLRDKGSAAVLITLTDTAGITLGAGGVLTWGMSAAETAVLPVVEWEGQLDVTLPSGEVQRQYSFSGRVVKGWNA